MASIKYISTYFKINISAFEAANYARPKNWYVDIWDLDPEDEENNGLQNEDLVICFCYFISELLSNQDSVSLDGLDANCSLAKLS